MALKDTWQNLIDGESEIAAEDINEIADAVIALEGVGYATSENAGVVKINSAAGVGIDSHGYLYVQKATSEIIDAKNNNYRPIVPANLEYAVKSVGDGYYATKEVVDSNVDRIIALENKIAKLETDMGDVETALDNIIAIQNNLIGGESV